MLQRQQRKLAEPDENYPEKLNEAEREDRALCTQLPMAIAKFSSPQNHLFRPGIFLDPQSGPSWHLRSLCSYWTEYCFCSGRHHQGPAKSMYLQRSHAGDYSVAAQKLGTGSSPAVKRCPAWCAEEGMRAHFYLKKIIQSDIFICMKKKLV
jgi:hypothetical protein